MYKEHWIHSLLYFKFVELTLVSNLLGHKSVETTQRYAGVLDEKRTEVVNKLGSAFG